MCDCALVHSRELKGISRMSAWTDDRPNNVYIMGHIVSLVLWSFWCGLLSQLDMIVAAVGGAYMLHSNTLCILCKS